LVKGFVPYETFINYMNSQKNGVVHVTNKDSCILV
jgi:hypothetical protein